jgi:hypothetical protein
MSGLEQRTKGRNEALAVASAGTAVIIGPPVGPPEWVPIDGDLLDERRAAVPAFPLELLPPPWRDWVSAAARSADVPVDYVAQALLAMVAGVSSTGVMVCFASGWLEPLQLWLAAAGGRSSGKSPALTLVRRLLSQLEADPIEGLGAPPRRIVLDQPTVEAVAGARARARHGVLLWRDGPGGCFAPLRGMPDARHLESLTVSILGSVEPEGAWRALPPGGEGLATHFLYAWPQAAPYSPLAERVYPKAAEVLVRLRRLMPLGALDRCILRFDKPGVLAFDAFLSRLHAEVRRADGLEAGWLGKGRGAVVCLAATFALMEWSETEGSEPPKTIGVDAVERAIALWSDYYRPHARAFLQSAAPTNVDCQARRVVRWLSDERRSIVSRTDVRRLALGRTVDTRDAKLLMSRLVEAGVLRPIAAEGPVRGRPVLRWHVNPMLAANQG